MASLGSKQTTLTLKQVSSLGKQVEVLTFSFFFSLSLRWHLASGVLAGWMYGWQVYDGSRQDAFDVSDKGSEELFSTCCPVNK